MLESVVTSKTRVKLLLKFFLNPQVRAYLRELSNEFNGSSNAVRIELNRLVKARLLNSQHEGRNIYYSANREHSLYPEIHNICKKITGIDYLYNFVSSFGEVTAAYVTGDYARGIDGGIIDLILVGNLDAGQVHDAVSKGEKIIGRRIRTLSLTPDEFVHLKDKLETDALLQVWGKESA
ncbi:MAG: winged helix-turn-helix transcriptional regulator [Deltaproteobacteria bacterium]|nr:winged helix-turn-helix transcriptional regulator [Deltaproteobacteria bacterium]